MTGDQLKCWLTRLNSESREYSHRLQLCHIAGFSVELDADRGDEQVHALFCRGSYELQPQLPVPPD